MLEDKVASLYLPCCHGEGLRGLIMRALLNTRIKNQYSSKQRMKPGLFGVTVKAFSNRFFRAGYTLCHIKTSECFNNALEMNTSAYFIACILEWTML